MSALLPSEVLSRAADLIEPKGAWIKHELARTAQGASVGPDDPKAVCWCMAGSVQKFAGYADAYTTLREYMIKTVGGGIAVFNDRPHRTQAEVVAALRKAAELAREQGQ